MADYEAEDECRKCNPPKKITATSKKSQQEAEINVQVAMALHMKLVHGG